MYIIPLIKRIESWEDMDDAVGQFEGAETLILDIKECLKSVIRDYVIT